MLYQCIDVKQTKNGSLNFDQNASICDGPTYISAYISLHPFSIKFVSLVLYVCIFNRFVPQDDPIDLFNVAFEQQLKGRYVHRTSQRV